MPFGGFRAWGPGRSPTHAIGFGPGREGLARGAYRKWDPRRAFEGLGRGRGRFG